MRFVVSCIWIGSLIWTCVTAPVFAQNLTIKTFREAKSLMRVVYKDQPLTFYCGCRFDEDGPNWQSCGYQTKGDMQRAARVEWEHVVPASVFGRHLPSWRDGDPACRTGKGKAYRGRKCATKVDPQFRLMSSDLYNLQPAIGEINGARRDYMFGEVAGEERSYGACDFEIAQGVVEPRSAIRGDIARTYLYMDAVYPGFSILSPPHRAMMQAWHALDPVDAWECKRYRKIKALQNSENPILAKLCEGTLFPD